MGYNSLGQFTSIGRYNNVAGGAANEVSTSTFGYTDAQGRLTSLVHNKGAVLQADYAWAYDAFNRLASFSSTKNPTENASYSYGRRRPI